MQGLKVITHKTYTYETSDGREFDDRQEAQEWQEKVSLLENVRMLDFTEKPTKNFEDVCYVYIETEEQARAYNEIQKYIGLCAQVKGPGYYRYDERKDDFVEVKSELEKLQHIVDILSQDYRRKRHETND